MCRLMSLYECYFITLQALSKVTFSTVSWTPEENNVHVGHVQFLRKVQFPTSLAMKLPHTGLFHI